MNIQLKLRKEEIKIYGRFYQAESLQMEEIEKWESIMDRIKCCGRYERKAQYTKFEKMMKVRNKGWFESNEKLSAHASLLITKTREEYWKSIGID